MVLQKGTRMLFFTIASSPYVWPFHQSTHTGSKMESNEETRHKGRCQKLETIDKARDFELS